MRYAGHEVLRDARHGIRRWRQRPLFALAAIATIFRLKAEATWTDFVASGFSREIAGHPQKHSSV